MPLRRLQSCPWVHWRLHFPFHAKQRCQPITKWRHVPQINWWMGLKKTPFSSRIIHNKTTQNIIIYIPISVHNKSNEFCSAIVSHVFKSEDPRGMNELTLWLFLWFSILPIMLTSLNGFHNFFFWKCMNVNMHDVLVLQNKLKINTLKLKVLLSSLQVCHSQYSLLIVLMMCT